MKTTPVVMGDHSQVEKENDFRLSPAVIDIDLALTAFANARR